MLRRTGIALFAVYALLHVSPADASAQLLCPPDTFLARSKGRLICARKGTPVKKRSAPRGRATASRRRPPDARKKVERKTVKSTLSCAEFNAKFTAFHGSYAERFGDKARRQDQTAARLRLLIDQQKRLRDELRSQSFRARDLRVRRHLRGQADAASRSIVAKEKELRELKRDNARNAGKWKADYKRKAAALLASRPRGCAVAAAK